MRCVHLLFQKLRLLRLDTDRLESCSTKDESVISSCLNNIGVLLVTVNAEGTSGIDLVSIAPFNIEAKPKTNFTSKIILRAIKWHSL